MERVTLGMMCPEKVVNISSDMDKIDYIDISSIDNVEKKVTGFTTYELSEAPSRAKQLLKEKDILISTVRPNLNAVAVCKDLEEKNQLVGSTGFCVLRPRNDIDERFIFYVCQSKYFVNSLMKVATGASYPAVSKDDVKNITVPQYSNVQKQDIANRLDILSKVITNRKEQLGQLDLLIKARFVEMFDDPKSNPKGYQKKQIKDTCRVVTGNTPSRAVEEYYGDYIEWIKTDNIVSGILNPSTASECLSEDGMKVGRTVEKNSILMACIAGSVASIGRVCVTDRSVAFNQQINAVIPEEYDYLFLYVMLQISKDYLVEEINMALKGILSKSKLEEKQFIVPPLELQNQFADFVQQVDKSKVVLQKSLDEIQMLFDSLMQKYFG